MVGQGYIKLKRDPIATDRNPATARDNLQLSQCISFYRKTHGKPEKLDNVFFLVICKDIESTVVCKNGMSKDIIAFGQIFVK